MRLDEIATTPAIDDGYVTLRPDSRLTVSNGALRVNGRPYVVEIPEGHLSSVKDGKLVVLHKGEYKEYGPSEIKGYWA